MKSADQHTPQHTYPDVGMPVFGRAAHSFRSTFRDWAAEETHHPNHVLEAALAHAISDKVEAAYRREDLCEKRQLLMADWAGFLRCQPAEVVPLAGERVGHAEAPG